MKKILKRKQQVEQLEDDDKMDPDGLLQEVDLNPPSYSINTNEVSLESEELESANDNLENKAIEKLWDIIKFEDTLKMGNDFYSLAFYGFYLEDDEDVKQLKNDGRRLPSEQTLMQKYSDLAVTRQRLLLA